MILVHSWKRSREGEEGRKRKRIVFRRVRKRPCSSGGNAYLRKAGKGVKIQSSLRSFTNGNYTTQGETQKEEKKNERKKKAGPIRFPRASVFHLKLKQSYERDDLSGSRTSI